MKDATETRGESVAGFESQVPAGGDAPASVDTSRQDPYRTLEHGSRTVETSADDIFHLLQNSRRRDVLAYLEETEQTTLRELAEHIAASENGVSVAGLRSAQRKRVYISLYQTHLPKLAAHGVIDYDKSRGTVALRDDSQLRPHVRLLEDTSHVGPHTPVARTVNSLVYTLLTVVVLLVIGGLLALTVF
jgi:hypothetical protein